MNKILLVAFSALYFLVLFVILTMTVVPQPYWIFVLPWFFLYILFWCIPIIYLWKKQQLFIKSIAIVIWMNIIILIGFFFFTETQYAIEIRQEPRKKATERARMKEEMIKIQESSTWSIQNNK